MINKILNALKKAAYGAPEAALMVIMAVAFVKLVAWAVDQVSAGNGSHAKNLVDVNAPFI